MMHSMINGKCVLNEGPVHCSSNIVKIIETRMMFQMDAYNTQIVSKSHNNLSMK